MKYKTLFSLLYILKSCSKIGSQSKILHFPLFCVCVSQTHFRMKRRRIIDLGDCLFCCSNSNFQTQNASQFPTHQTEQKRRRQKTRIKLDVAKVVHSLCRCELEFELQPNARVILQIKFEHGVGRIVYTITD